MKHDRQSRRAPGLGWVLLALLLPMGTATANEGLVLFVGGDVTAQRGERVVNLRRGVKIREGDTIRTGIAGRTHIRMRDRTLISLRPDTEFVIETYRYEGPTVAAGIDPERAARTTQAGQQSQARGRSVYNLLRGGFRTITGLIGKVDRSAFSVRTPVATIGIRGTTFTAVCLADCTSGLVFGVSLGGISATNNAGTLNADLREFGYIASMDDPPQLLADRPSQLDEGFDMSTSEDDEVTEDDLGTDTDIDNLEPEEGDVGVVAEGDDTQTTEQLDETVTVENEFPVQPEQRIVVLSTAASFPHPGVPPIIAGNLPPDGVRVGENNELRETALIGFSANAAEELALLRFGSQPNAPLESDNQGFDPVSGISWGRYAAGGVRISEGDQNFDANAAAIGPHWALGPAASNAVALPQTGTANFPLVGNTDPTSDTGSRGFLGDATLVADFAAQTVESTLAIGIDDQAWVATGSGRFGAQLGPGIAPNLFAGLYDEVLVSGQEGGEGQFSGLVSGDGDEVFGAALGYQLNGPGDVESRSSIAGVAIFGAPPAP